MIRTLVFRAAAALTLAAVLPTGPALAQEKVSTDKLLPPNVFAYVAVPDVQVLKERVNDTAFGAMLDDPQLEPTLEQIRNKLDEVGGKVQENLGVSTEELLAVPAGEVAFAVADVPGESVGFVMLVDHGTNTATIDRLVEKAESELQKKGATRTVEQFEGTEIIVYATKSEVGAEDDLDIEEEEPTTPPGGAADSVAWFRKDNRFVLGNAVPILEAVLARWDGSHDETFASNEVYQTILDKTRTDDREPAFVFYADPLGGLQTALTRAENIPPQFQIVAGILPMLGLTNLKAVGGSVDMATEEFDSISKAFFYVEAPPSGDLGLLGVFEFSPAELSPPEWVSEAATGYFSANWNVTGAVTSVQKLVDTFQGPGAFDALMQRAANAPNGPKINPQKDLLDQLSGMIHVANYPIVVPRTQPADEATAVQQPVVIALDVKDEQRMSDVLARLAETPNFPGESREFQGTTVYELPMRSPQGGEPSKTAVAVAKGHLIFATSPERLEDVLRSTGEASLAESEDFKKIASHFPDQASMIGYQDQKEQLKSLYERLRSGEASNQVEGFDFTTLPPFEDIVRYLRATGSYAIPDENGALLVNFSLKLEK